MVYQLIVNSPYVILILFWSQYNFFPIVFLHLLPSLSASFLLLQFTIISFNQFSSTKTTQTKKLYIMNLLCWSPSCHFCISWSHFLQSASWKSQRTELELLLVLRDVGRSSLQSHWELEAPWKGRKGEVKKKGDATARNRL